MRPVKTLLAAATALALTTTLHAGGEDWTSDFKAAKAQAEKEGKDLLIDFTGSDWCGWCIKLNKEVFVHDAFKNGGIKSMRERLVKAKEMAAKPDKPAEPKPDLPEPKAEEAEKADSAE